MSTPVLLTALDTKNEIAIVAAPAQTPPPTQPTSTVSLLDEHIESCASYGEVSAAITPHFVATSANEIDVTDESKLACTPILRHFTVQMNAELETNELVGITGDSKALGEWQLENCVTLRPVGDQQWSASALLQACRNVNYRYFVYVHDKQGRKQIRRWETQPHPRQLKSCNANCRETDYFGMPEANGEAAQVNRGWLTNESIVQLKFEREKMFQVRDIDKFDPENVLIKLIPLEDDLETELEPLEAGINIEVAKLKYAESQLETQQSFGVSYKRGDVIIFHVTVPNPLENAFAIYFYTPERKPMGKTIVLASDLLGSEGQLELSITEPIKHAQHIIARLSLPYLIVKPFTESTLDFRSTYAHYWPKSWPNLDVGHRGNGRSFIAQPPEERENTLASFMRAYESFADMVEFDVHLTADGVPIIYHDFGVRTAPQGKKITSAAQLEYVLVKDLTYEALKKLRIFAVINNEAIEYPSYNTEPRVEHRIFPRLLDVLEVLPKSVGFDVEIKWPQLKACGLYENQAQQSMDKNFFIDRVLSIVVKHACGRPLIFSSFDADICTMLRFKQNIFPVMFLTQGETKKWEPFMDLRTRTVEQAINNAQAFELAGTAPHAEDLLGENGVPLMQKAHALGQIALVWGDDCNSKERVKYFREIGATATCYDRADLYVPESKQRSFFNSSSLLAEFEDKCRP